VEAQKERRDGARSPPTENRGGGTATGRNGAAAHQRPAEITNRPGQRVEPENSRPQHSRPRRGRDSRKRQIGSNGSYERPANDYRQPRRGSSGADASKRKWANGEDDPSSPAQVRRPRRIWAGSAHAQIRANFHAGLELSRARTRTVITTNLASPRSEHSSLATSFTSMDAHVTHIPI
jgi:hypothetical protein